MSVKAGCGKSEALTLGNSISAGALGVVNLGPVDALPTAYEECQSELDRCE
jgi:hypothetical protein